MTCGLWVLTGFLVFIIAEKIFIGESESNSEEKEENTQKCKLGDKDFFKKATLKEFENNNCLMSSDGNVLTKLCTRNGNVKHSVQGSSEVELKFDLNKDSKGHKTPVKNEMLEYPKEKSVPNGIQINGTNGINVVPKNGFIARDFVPSSLENSNGFIRNGSCKPDTKSKKIERRSAENNNKPKHISGYLNLMANCIDNFTHGLAVGGSFLISFRLGALTTFAILIHEIPHEVGDFAILLRSGFNRWDAARAQLLTATGGIIGALVAVLCSGSGVGELTYFLNKLKNLNNFWNFEFKTDFVLCRIKNQLDPSIYSRRLLTYRDGFCFTRVAQRNESQRIFKTVRCSTHGHYDYGVFDCILRLKQCTY